MTRTLALANSALLLLLAGCAPASFLVTAVPSEHKLVEQVVQRESFWALRKVALIDVDGVMANRRPTSLLGPAGENPVAFFTEKLEHAANDDSVKAIVIRINSPGGDVTASDLMYSELLRFREETGKPVIAAMLDIAASGGYYLACAADRIYAQPTTVTGSIGVVMIAPEFSGTMHKLGVAVNVIKSGDMKDMGSLFREMNERDRTLFQGLINKMYERFLNVVARSRTNIERERLRKLADGRVYFGPDARELGLIDEIGTLHDAIQAAKRAANLADTPIKVVRYRRPFAHRPNIYAAQQLPPPQINLINLALPEWLSQPAPRFLYLWAPSW